MAQDNQDVSALDILNLAQAGDARAVKIVRQRSEIVADIVVNLSLILNPELIVLGGEIGSHRALIDLVQKQLEGGEFAVTKIASSPVDRRAVLWGWHRAGPRGASVGSSSSTGTVISSRCPEYLQSRPLCYRTLEISLPALLPAFDRALRRQPMNCARENCYAKAVHRHVAVHRDMKCPRSGSSHSGFGIKRTQLRASRRGW